MRVWTLVATVVIGSFAASNVLAQAPAAGAAATANRTIGVIDMGYILKNHPTMKSQMEAIQAQMEAADKEMADKRDAIVKQMEQLKDQYNEGTAEYEQREKAIAEQDTTFRLELVKKRKEFETAQANVLFKVYSEINFFLTHLNKTAGVQVVLRVTREKMDPKNPETIQLVMSQDVLYYNEGVDYTEWVLAGMKQNAGQTANAAASPKR